MRPNTGASGDSTSPCMEKGTVLEALRLHDGARD